MAFYKSRYEVVEGKIRDLQEERKSLIDLVMELFRQVEELERRLDELYHSCTEEDWFQGKNKKDKPADDFCTSRLTWTDAQECL